MNKQILLIDDDIDELYIFKEALNEINHSIVCLYAETIVDGIRLLKNAVPDFIFMDINMPGIDGFEGIRMINKMENCQKVPLFVYSTAVDYDLNIRAMAMGASASVKKPASIPVLARVLKAILKNDEVGVV